MLLRLGYLLLQETVLFSAFYETMEPGLS